MTRDVQRWKQISSGVGVVVAVSLLLAGLFSIQFLPGLPGQAAGWMAGLMTTPFFMEAGLAVIGFCVVILLNHWRNKWDGDEFVSLEVKQEVADSLQKTSTLTNPQAVAEAPAKLAQALAAHDHTAAFRILAEMPDELRNSPAVVEMRIELAKAGGMRELADRLASHLKGAATAGEPS